MRHWRQTIIPKTGFDLSRFDFHYNCRPLYHIPVRESMESELPRLKKSSSLSHGKTGIEWRNTLATKSHSARNVLSQSTYDFLKTEALKQNKHHLPPKDSVKPLNDHTKTRKAHAGTHIDHQSAYQPSISHKSSSSADGHIEGSDHRHAIKRIYPVNHCR